MFSYEFCKISKNTFYYRTPLVAASVSKVVNQGTENITKWKANLVDGSKNLTCKVGVSSTKFSNISQNLPFEAKAI